MKISIIMSPDALLIREVNIPPCCQEGRIFLWSQVFGGLKGWRRKQTSRLAEGSVKVPLLSSFSIDSSPCVLKVLDNVC